MSRKKRVLRDKELADLVTKMLDEPEDTGMVVGEESQNLGEVAHEFIGMSCGRRD